jgi:hypothetical protein
MLLSRTEHCDVLTLEQVRTDTEGRHKTKSGFLSALKRSH